MPTSRNFDPVAHIYDETRLLPDAVREAGIPAILDYFPPAARVLDAGTGTGRIGIPLLERGVDVYGIDLSMNMMARQRAKYPAAQLTRGSVTDMPFGDGTFDAIITAHVLHLIPDWRGALAEFKHVLRPGGVYLNVRSEPTGRSPWQEANRYWREWLRNHGGQEEVEPVGTWDQDEILAALHELGAVVTTQSVVEYPTSYKLRKRIEGILNRSQSSAWDVPDDLLQASVGALEGWITETYGGLDIELADEQAFRIYAAKFAS